MLRSCELFLCRDILRFPRPSEISLNNEHNLHIVITTNLFLFLCHIIIDLILILIIYVNNCKEFCGETSIL